MKALAMLVAVSCFGGAAYVAMATGGLFGISYAPLLLAIKGALWILIAAVCEVTAAIQANGAK